MRLRAREVVSFAGSGTWAATLLFAGLSVRLILLMFGPTASTPWAFEVMNPGSVHEEDVIRAHRFGAFFE